MFDNLSQRLARVVKQLRGEARLTDANIQDALREVRLALLEADVALPVVKEFIAKVKDRAVGAEVAGSLTPGQAFIGVVHRELAALMGGAAVPLDFAVQPPAVLLMAGLQGSGKTTTTAKLAHLLRGQKKKVLVVSADVYRPAAIEQLATLAKQVGVDHFPSAVGEEPVAIAQAALGCTSHLAADFLAGTMSELFGAAAEYGAVNELFANIAHERRDPSLVRKHGIDRRRDGSFAQFERDKSRRRR